MTNQDKNKMLARLAELDQKTTDNGDGQWEIEKEEHSYKDGTTHFTHVRYKSHDMDGDVMTVQIGGYLTPDLAELLVTMRNNLSEIIRLARIGLEVETL